MFCGCNVENGLLGLSICAERVALSKAISEGKRDFEVIAVAAQPLATPCGPCRQFMIEFNPELKVVSADADDLKTFRINTVAELLPDYFQLDKDGE